MRTHRRTVDFRSLLSDNERLDTFLSTSFINSSATITTTTTLSITPDQATAATLKSDVWHYFEGIAYVPPLKARCKICLEELATTNWKRQLTQRHNLQ